MVADHNGVVSVRLEPVGLLGGLRPRQEWLYDVVPGDHDVPGYVALSGTEEECRQWRDAADTYRTAVTEAVGRLRAVESGPWWLRWLPGRVKRARRRFEERFDAAGERYRPVMEVIDERFRLHREEERRLLEQRLRATVQRCLPLAERAVWEWIQARPSAVYVFRHDVPPAHVLPRGRRAAEPLDAVGLLAALAGLIEGGVARIDWDANARRAVEDECSVPGDRVSNGRWWGLVMTGRWPRLKQPPAALKHFPSSTSFGSSERSWGSAYADRYSYHDDGYREPDTGRGHYFGGYHGSYGSPF
ncbi:hypothetical protein ACWGB8_30005 [Kitasatospora sp. NPDC054939]